MAIEEMVLAGACIFFYNNASVTDVENILQHHQADYLCDTTDDIFHITVRRKIYGQSQGLL